MDESIGFIARGEWDPDMFMEDILEGSVANMKILRNMDKADRDHAIRLAGLIPEEFDDLW